jgi:hypothetical protein
LSVAFALLAIVRPSQAGILDRCDLARIAARNEILTDYDRVLSAVSIMPTEAQSGRATQTRSFYTDRDGRARSVDMRAVVSELKNREATDLGNTDRAVASRCRGDTNPMENAVQGAKSLAERDISSVLSKHMTNVGQSQIGQLPRGVAGGGG